MNQNRNQRRTARTRASAQQQGFVAELHLDLRLVVLLRACEQLDGRTGLGGRETEEERVQSKWNHVCKTLHILFVFIEKEITRCQHHQKVLDPLELVLLSRHFATGDHRAGTENILQSLANLGSLRIRTANM